MDSNLPAKFPDPVLNKNEKNARILIWSVSIIVFLGIAGLSGIHLDYQLSFDPHLFAAFNAIANSVVAILLIAGLVSVKKKITGCTRR